MAIRLEHTRKVIFALPGLVRTIVLLSVLPACSLTTEALVGKQCVPETGECATGYVCSASGMCVLPAQLSSDTNPPTPGGEQESVNDSGIAPPPFSADAEVAMEAATEAAASQLPTALGCGLTPRFNCESTEKCCIHHGETDECVARDNRCECKTNPCWQDEAYCQDSSDCGDSSECCYTTEKRRGTVLCVPAGTCTGYVVCNEADCDANTCSYEDILNARCSGNAEGQKN